MVSCHAKMLNLSCVCTFKYFAGAFPIETCLPWEENTQLLPRCDGLFLVELIEHLWSKFFMWQVNDCKWHDGLVKYLLYV